MRLRTGHGANDWTENEPGGFARLSGHSGSSIHGELVRGGESDADRQKRQSREHMRRYRARDEYQSSAMWRQQRREAAPKCGYLMPLVGQICVRTPGHRSDHMTESAMERKRASRRKDAA